EDVQLRVVGVSGVEVVVVVAAPEERLAARDVLDVVGVHAPPVQDGVLRVGEVVAHRPDDAYVGEEAGRQREVRGGSAQHPLALAEGRAHCVEGDGSDHYEAHAARKPSYLMVGCLSYWPSPRASRGAWPTSSAA